MTVQASTAGLQELKPAANRRGLACALAHPSQKRRTRGGNLVEFTLVAFLLFVAILGVFEFSRMILVYSSVAHAARVALRYATANGADKGTPATQTSVCAVVTNYITAVNTSALTCGGTTGSRIAVTWSSVGDYGAEQPGSLVQVTVVYLYDPFFSYLPLKIKLGSTAEGYINY